MTKKTILVVDDNAASRLSTEILLKPDFNCVGIGSKKEFKHAIETQRFDAIVLDLLMPDVKGFELLTMAKKTPSLTPVVLLTSHYNIPDAVKAIKLNADDYIIKSDAEKLLKPALEKALYQEKTATTSYQSIPLLNEKDKPMIIPQSSQYQTAYSQLKRAIELGISTLITGPTGVGKDMIVHYIHQTFFPEKPLVVLNCGAISPALAESELFGHEKGAFTDAKEAQKGKLELANNGILFLDEIGNMSIDIQQKLLRALEDRYIYPIGSTQKVPTSFTLISATNKDLHEAVQNNTFREDLLYRIQHLQIQLPSLKETPHLIEDFSRFFTNHYNQQFNTQFELTPALISYYKTQEWPGNIRQLDHEIQKAVAFGITPDLQTPSPDTPSLHDEMNAFLRNQIIASLKENKANIAKTARALGFKRTTLLRRIDALNIDIAELKYNLKK